MPSCQSPLAGDHWPPSLADHHIAYRAQVRAKVAAIRADQGVAGAAEQARALLVMARRHLEAARVRLVLVGGLPGTGKSTVAAALGEQAGWEVLRSDVVRKELAGLDPQASGAAAFGTGIYTREATDATYRALLERARPLLERGRTVVLDASWTDAEHRRWAEALAAATTSDLIELRCVAPAEVAAGRIRARAAAGRDPSDADEAVAAAMAASADPWPSAIELDTTPPVEEVAGAARAAVLAVPAPLD